MVQFQKEKVNTLAFDVDGTLFSSEDIIAKTYKLAISGYAETSGQKIHVPGHNEIMLQIGKPVKTIFKNLLPDLPENERDLISDRVLKQLCSLIDNGEGSYYDGVADTIRNLHGRNLRLLLASNGRRPYLESIVKYAGIDELFGEIVVIDNTTIKTKGEILARYLEIFNLQPEELLMIGDRSSDMEAAIFTGSPFAFCTYGHAPEGEVNEYSFAINSLPELVNWFKN